MLTLLMGLSAMAAQPMTVAKEADTPEHAIRSYFRACEADDEKAFSRLTSEHFYAFETNKPVTGRELFDTVKGLHASGTVLQWNLGPIDVHTTGSAAWATWENHGAVGKTNALQPVTWLESAALHRSGRRWVLDFLHSSRMQPLPPVKP